MNMCEILTERIWLVVQNKIPKLHDKLKKIYLTFFNIPRELIVHYGGVRHPHRILPTSD
jgi:hypothetical protein